MTAGHYGLQPADEVRRGDTYYVGYTKEQIKEFEEVRKDATRRNQG